jgi:hypothetical protein
MKDDRLRSPDPPPLEQFALMVRGAALVESVRAIRKKVCLNAMVNAAWSPHLKFIDDFMREHRIDRSRICVMILCKA